MKMGKQIVTVIFLVTLFTNIVAAQDRGFGLGIIVGEPTGISLKNWLTHSKAVDFAIAWSFVNSNSLTIHADYLSHTYKLLNVKKEGGSDYYTPLYYGIGGRVKIEDDQHNDDVRLGVRIPFGINYFFKSITIDLFLEIAPILDLVPETDFKLNAAIGVRYFFH